MESNNKVEFDCKCGNCDKSFKAIGIPIVNTEEGSLVQTCCTECGKPLFVMMKKRIFNNLRKIYDIEHKHEKENNQCQELTQP